MIEEKVEHSRLFSASGAARWINCPASATETADIVEEPSPYAEYGTLAHSLSDICLVNGTDTDDYPLTGEWSKFDPEMREGVQKYIDFVRDYHKNFPGEMVCEEKVSYEQWVPEGFGTADVQILSENILTVIDLKFGMMKVDAHQNPQMMLYALGAYSEHEFGYDWKKFRVIIAQPRLNWYDWYEGPISELLAFGETARKAAQRALEPDPEFTPGAKQCQWCKIKGDCRARADLNKKIAYEEFDEPLIEPSRLSMDEIAKLLPILDDMAKWCKDVQAYAAKEAMAGKKVKGYKLVRGQAKSRWTGNALEKLKDHPKAEELITHGIVGIGAAKKVLGDDPILKEVIEKPEGKAVLVVETDRRKELNRLDEAKDDFSEDV